MGTKLNPSRFDAYAKARPNETYFTFLARDPFAPQMLRRWATLMEDEIANGRRSVYDVGQVQECRKIADDMEAWHNDPANAEWTRPDPRDKLHARNSPGPINCNIRKRFQRERETLVCERCGTDPCPFFEDDGTAK